MGRNQEFYHATRAHLDVGQDIIPSRDLNFRPPGHPFHDPDDWESSGDREAYEWAEHTSQSHTYFSDNLEHGRNFLSRGTIYKVQPTGPYWEDHAAGTYESKHPLKILGVAEHIGKRE